MRTNDEQIAIITFINTLPPASILREIAERRLADLVRGEAMCVEIDDDVFEKPYMLRDIPKPPVYRFKCPDLKMGFVSLNQAAYKMKVNYQTLYNDIKRETYKYGVYPILSVA